MPAIDLAGDLIRVFEALENGSIYYTALIYKRFFYNFYFSLFFAFSYI